MESERQMGRPSLGAVYQALTPSVRTVSLTETQRSDAAHEALIHPLSENGLTEVEESDAHTPNVQVDEKAMREPRARRWNNLRSWWLEILCLGVVTAALLAISFTLSTYQNRPLPQWPLKVSVNSLVAVYVVVLKGAMLLIITEGLSQMKWTWYRRSRPLEELARFDSASRGPWGAIQLIWALQARHLIASVGAILIVVALAVDPVSQLLIRYYNCSVELPATQSQASIPRRNTFSEMGLHIGAGLSTLTFEFQTAINAGLFNPVSVDISFACPTGNCTYDLYHTVAYCSKCTDLSSSLSTSWGLMRTETETVQEGSSFYNVSHPVYGSMTSLPDGFSTTAEKGLVEYLKFNATHRDYGITMIAANLTNAYQHTGNNCTTAAENKTWYCHGSGAAGCTLYPCIRSYTATVNESKLQEILVSTSAEFGSDDLKMSSNSVNVACLTPETRQDLINIGYSITDTTEWVAYYGSGVLGNTTAVAPVFNASVPNVTVPGECQYLIYEPTQMSLGLYMSSFFNGSVTADPELTYDYYTNGPVQINRFYNVAQMSFDSVSAIFSNISDSMTAYIRQSHTTSMGSTVLNDDQAAPAPGHVFQTETCIEVRWGYLAFPIALVLLTMIFLVAVIMETSRHHEADAWKSSALALLFHGLDPRTRDLHGAGMESLEEMEKAAKGMRVRLRREEERLMFVNTN